MLKNNLVPLYAGGIEILVYDLIIIFRWAFYFLPSFLAGEFYLEHFVSNVIPVIGALIWNLFAFLVPLSKMLFNDSLCYTYLCGFFDFYHEILLTLNNVMEILLLGVLAIVKTWLYVRTFLYSFLLVYYSNSINPQTNPIIRMTYERVEL